MWPVCKFCSFALECELSKCLLFFFGKRDEVTVTLHWTGMSVPVITEMQCCMCDWYRSRDYHGVFFFFFFKEEESRGRGNGGWTAGVGESLEEELWGKSSLPWFTKTLQIGTYQGFLVVFCSLFLFFFFFFFSCVYVWCVCVHVCIWTLG